MKRQGLFNGFWLTRDGKRIRRIRRNEYGELYRLWAKLADVRSGRAKEMTAFQRAADNGDVA